MAFNNSNNHGQQGSKYLDWARCFIREVGNGTNDGVEGRLVVQQPPTTNYDPIWTENTSPNDHVQHQRDGNHRGGYRGYQSRFGQDYNQRRNYEGRQDHIRGHFNGRTYGNGSFANRGGYRKPNYNNNCNTQAREKSNYVPPSSNTAWQRSKPARVAPYTKGQLRDRDVQSQSSSDEQSDDSKKQDYFNDLMQYVQRRYELFGNSHHQSKPWRRSSSERDNRSRCSSSERDNRSRRSSSERDNRSRRSSSERDNRSRRLSSERDNESRRSSSEHVNISAKRSSTKTSGWDKKPATISKSRTSSTALSNSENESSVANKRPSSPTRKTDVNRPTSTSNVPEPTNSSSNKSRQSNVGKSIVAQSLTMTTQSSKISSASNNSPTKVGSMEVSSTSTNEVPSSDTQKDNINLSTSTPNVPESANSSSIKSHQSVIDQLIVVQSTIITTQSTDTPSSSIIPEPNAILPPLTNVELMEISVTPTSTSTNEVPSSNVQQTNINLSTSTSNVPESTLTANASQSNVDHSIASSSNDLLSMTIVPEPSKIILPPSAIVEPMELSQTLTNNENETDNDGFHHSDNNQPIDLSNKLKSTEIPLIDLTKTTDGVEYSANSSYDIVATSSIADSSAKLDAKPSDNSDSSSDPPVIYISDVDDDEYSTTSIPEKGDKSSTTNMLLISPESPSPINKAPMAIHNFETPVKPSDKANRKRSLDICNATESGDQNSNATASNTQPSDADESPSKKSMQHASIPERTIEENNQGEIIEQTNERNNNVIAKTIEPTTSSPNQNQSNPVVPIVATTATSKDVPKKPVNSVNNEIISEKTERKANFHLKEIDKKPKKFSTEKKESRIDKPINFKKNHIEQFKFILKIMKTRSSSWSLSHSSDINVNNFCDAIHHFEKQSDRICALTEVKFFDDTGKFNKINFKNLFGDEFNIQRYFATFYKFEKSCFSNQHSKFVIMTNREIDIALFYNNGIKVSCDNDCYTLKVKQPYDESKIYKKCLECFVLPKLAELLCEFVRSDRKIPHFNMELIRKYHLALVKEKVLQLVEDKKNRDKVAKFHPHFIEGIELSNAAMELRYHLEKLLRGLPTESMKFRVGNKDFGEDVSSMRYGGTVDKLPDENCKATFEHFFKVFMIVKITKLSDQTIEKELGEKFLKLEQPAYFNAVKEELLIFLKNYGLTSDILESLKHTISKLGVTEKISQRPHHSIEIQFEQETFANLSTAIAREDVILCSTDSLLLSELKMRQFSESQESFIVTEKILFEMTDDVISAFSHRSTNLLVILWEENVVTDSRRIDEVIEKIREVTSKSQAKKKCIIVANKCNVNLSSPRYQIFRIDENLSFKSSNDRFETTKVSLQGRTLQLSDLADNAAINNLIKNPKILEKILIEEMKIGHTLSKPAGFKEKLYDFKLKQRVIVSPKIFQENIDDIFLISNIDCENFSLEYKPSDKVICLSNAQLKTFDLPVNTRYFVLDNNVNPVFICNKIKDKNVHQLKYESNNFIWKSTNGSSAALLKYKVTDEKDNCVSFGIEDILINGPKTIILSGESGIGKSVCLYDFANHVHKSYEDVWTIQVDLNQSLKQTLKGYPIETSENAIHFLADYLDLKDEQKQLFIMGAQGQLKIKLMLFVDGYDDTYENVNLMTNLLRHLQNSKVERMFVTSRTDKLENVLSTFSYSLQFGIEDQFQFVDKFCNGKDFKYNLSSKIKFLDTPLHLKMYMELCQRKPEKSYIDNLYDLYKSYVNLYLTSSNLENAYKLSAQKLLTKNELEEIGVAVENVDLELPEELSRKTVIEYFTAKWLSKRHLNTKKYIDNLIERTSSVFLNVYLSAYKTEKKNKISINEYAENGFLSSLKAILELDATNKPCLCRLIRKGKNQTKEVLQFLLEYYNDTGCREFIQHVKYVDSNLVKYVNQQVKGQTPLQIAAEKNKMDLACELMLKGADISVLSSSLIASMAIYAAKELAKGNIRLGSIAVILLEKSPQTTAHLDVETEFPKVLAYLFSHGHAKLIEQLLNVRNNEDRRKLLETRVNGKSLLDHVNESEIIDDLERRQLILYLANNLNNPNFLQLNIDSILRSACIYGHEQTFNYFITHSKSSIDVLHEALRSNNEKIINFLMRDSKRTIDSNGNNALHQSIILGVSRKTMNYLLGKVGINDINNEGETVLHLAFKEGANLSTIKFLIDAGASLTVTNKLGFYPWIIAIKEESSRYCKQQQRELMMYLQTKNICFPKAKNPNHTFDSTRKEILPKLHYFQNLDDYNLDYDENGDSRLHTVIPCSDEKNWCIFLINHGADVNVVKDGKSAFYLALEYKRYDVAKLMLQHGAIIDMTDKTGKTPLNCLKNHASDSYCQTMVEILLLACNIFDNKNNELTKTIQSIDPSKIDNSYFRYLLNCRNKYGMTLLHVAALNGDANAIINLYKFSNECQSRYKDFVPIDVNATDNRGNTPLHLAVKKNEKCVATLLLLGARFQVKNLDGNKPMDLTYSGSSIRKWLQAAEDLFKLVELKRVEDVRKLLKTYPDVQNARDNSGKTPLHLARDEKLMRLLLANKYVDVNASDGEKRSPIYYAMEENYLDGVKLLLKAGASYDFKGIQNGMKESFKLLQKINELFDDMHSHEPKFFVKGNYWTLDKQLDDIANAFRITRDIIVNVRDNHRNSLLHYAAKYDYVDVIENLLKNGAIYNSRNKYGKTPMDLAINSKGLLKSVDDLFKNLDVNTWINVDPTIAVNCRMSGGFTLLHKAMEIGNVETYNWLVDRGADVRATTNNSVGMRFNNQMKISKFP